nr:sugar phosphate nucleotidyltransferase [Cohnella sp. CFH 77786]
MSGGGGTRLWPLSQPDRPKQFIKLITKRDGKQISMVENIWDKLASRYGADNLYIAANVKNEVILREQLGDNARIISEPEQRDTFPAIALACSYLYSLESVPLKETIVTVPVDSFADDEFYSLFETLDSIIAEEVAKIALVGVLPKRATEKYGYIELAGECSDRCLYVHKFIEKPSSELAMKLMQSGALWNGGVYAFRLGYVMRLLEQLNHPSGYHYLYTNYNALPKISFDYMVTEREESIACLKYEGVWSDLGTWDEIAHLLEPSSSSLTIMNDNCINTLTINQLGIPIVVNGISDSVIVAGPEGILISGLGALQSIKPLIERALMERSNPR